MLEQLLQNTPVVPMEITSPDGPNTDDGEPGCSNWPDTSQLASPDPGAHMVRHNCVFLFLPIPFHKILLRTYCKLDLLFVFVYICLFVLFMGSLQ